MNKLFVYGIFLDEGNRLRYGMTNPRYATVADYATYGGHIVSARPTSGAQLTGLVVDVDPDYWSAIDSLEGGYDRVVVDTSIGIQTFMYQGKEYLYEWY